MGAYGASGHRDFFIGSNAYYTIKHACCPVLIVPEGKRWQDFNRVLFPLRPTLGAFKKYQYISDLGYKDLSGLQFSNYWVFPSTEKNRM